MSSHFINEDEVPKPGDKSSNHGKSSSWIQRFGAYTRKLVKFYPTDMNNPQHRRLMNQARIRAVVVMVMMVYYGYHHPEYSIVSAWYHGSDKPLAEQRYQKLSGGDSSGTERQQKAVESIMSNSYATGLQSAEGKQRG